MSDISPPESAEGHVVVVGAGLAGLVFGRVLAEFADRVSVLDHDELPDGAEFRRGAGQARHTHMLLDRGREIYEELFPGVVDECSVPGTEPFDSGAKFRWHHFGMWRPMPEVGVELWPIDRRAFEWAVRRRLEERDDVALIPGRKAVDFALDDERTALRGVVFETDGGRETWPAELVVDAMGRGTRTPHLLEEYGLGPVSSHSYDGDVSYTTTEIREPAGDEPDWRMLFILPESFDSPKMGVAYRLNEDEYRVTMGGWSGESAPTDDAGFREFARELAHPSLHEFLDSTEICSELRRYQIPKMEFRRYDEMEDRPDGLVVGGDGFCNFNPIFAQGMSIAAREALTLRDILEEEHPSDSVASSRALEDYHDRAADLISESWEMTAALDSRFPGVEGDPPISGFMVPFVENLHRSSCRYASVQKALARMMHMQAEPTVLLKPTVFAGLTATALRRLVGFDA